MIQARHGNLIIHSLINSKAVHNIDLLVVIFSPEKQKSMGIFSLRIRLTVIKAGTNAMMADLYCHKKMGRLKIQKAKTMQQAFFHNDDANRKGQGKR